MFFYGRIPKNKTLKREYKAFKEVFFIDFPLSYGTIYVN